MTMSKWIKGEGFRDSGLAEVLNPSYHLCLDGNCGTAEGWVDPFLCNYNASAAILGCGGGASAVAYIV